MSSEGWQRLQLKLWKSSTVLISGFFISVFVCSYQPRLIGLMGWRTHHIPYHMPPFEGEQMCITKQRVCGRTSVPLMAFTPRIFQPVGRLWPATMKLDGEFSDSNAECVYKIEERVTYVTHLLSAVVNFLLLSIHQCPRGPWIISGRSSIVSDLVMFVLTVAALHSLSGGTPGSLCM